MSILFIVFLAPLGAALNRLRGGWLKELTGTSSTLLCRLAWAVPTGMLLYFLTTPDVWSRLPLLLLSSFGMWALWGSGAHSVMSFFVWKHLWVNGREPVDTEIYTQWWLPKLFGGVPTAIWDEKAFWAYHIIGKSTEGFLRMLTMIIPIILMLDLGDIGLFLLSGLLWGPIYWVTWIIDDTDGWRLGEWVTGGLTYLTIGVTLLL